MIREVHCLVLVCDSCGAALSEPGDDRELHYEAAEQARTDATRDLCWSHHGGRDFCPPCTCAERGHEWALWIPDPSTALSPRRWCDRCDTSEPISDDARQALTSCSGGGSLRGGGR